MDVDRTSSASGGRGDLGRELARANVFERMFGHSSPPLRISRYDVLRKIGEGGMGQVYLCRDAQLGREIAVKLVHPRRAGAQTRARVMREAQGLARLSHPNVVQIYEVGEADGALFLAMEFIPGKTLRKHLQDLPSLDWRARLELLMQAGRGLAAAHGVGLIHRDIKPDNILVGDDERVRVLDFGLARGLDELSGRPVPAEQFANTQDGGDGEASGTESLQTLTIEGTLLGTPAYMAPEQFEGRACDALADQFAFCVVAHEVLYGERPFAGRSLVELREAVTRGRLTHAPASARVPRRLRAALLRGLAVAPSQRWPDMPALLAVFEAVLGRRRRAWLAVGGVALLGVGVVTSRLLSPAAAVTPACQIGLEQLDGTWDDARRTSLRAAHAAIGSPTETGLGAIERSLDAWAQRWVEVQTQVCEATQVSGVQSHQLLDDRSACLSRVRREAAAVIDVLGRADARTIAHGMELLAVLPDPTICSSDDVDELRELLPADPQRRAQIEAGYADIIGVEALAAAGRLKEADARVEQLRAQLEHSDHAPLRVELDALLASAQLWHRNLEAGLPMLIDAARAAERLRLDDRVASLRVLAADWAAGNWGHPEREQWLIDEADAALARIGRSDDVRQVSLQLARANLLTDAGDHSGALALREAAVERALAIGATDKALSARRVVGASLVGLGRFDEAREALERACADVRARWGGGVPMLADCEFELAALEGQVGRFEQARSHYDRARDIYVEVLGPDAPEVARVDHGRATLAMLGGDFAGAEQLLDEVIATREREPERWPEPLADTLELHGAVRFYRGQYRDAVASYRRALELRRRVFDEHHPLIGNLHANIGEALVALGEHDAARAEFALALASLERTLPAEHPSLALPYKARGQSSLALGDVVAARDDLEHALRLQANSGEPLELADIEFSLAQALAELGEPARARELAVQARERFADSNQSDRTAAIDIWLTQQPRHD